VYAPDGYLLRAAAAADVDAVCAVVDAEDREHWGNEGAGSFWLRSTWSRPSFDPANDAWVIEHDGVVAAFGHVFDEQPRREFEGAGVVHPAHKGGGLGQLLVRRLDAAAQGRPHDAGAVVRATTWANDGPALGLLASAGYRPIRGFLHMAVALPTEPTAHSPGVVVRPIADEEDLRAVHAVIDAAFADHWDHRTTPFDEWWERANGPWHDPELVLLASVDGEVAGALRAHQLRNGLGWIDELGVARAWRGRAIGATLLAHAFERLATRGAHEAWLNVDETNETGATRLYERVGMAARRRWTLHERELAP